MFPLGKLRVLFEGFVVRATIAWIFSNMMETWIFVLLPISRGQEREAPFWDTIQAQISD
jgi:hypothetical protein